MEKKENLTGLFRDDPRTPEGKYLIKRRDGTVVEWPSFVLGGRDPIAEIALRSYAREAERIFNTDPRLSESLGLTKQYVDRLFDYADEFLKYRTRFGQGDPGKGQHRRDDPTTIEEMKSGHSA